MALLLWLGYAPHAAAQPPADQVASQSLNSFTANATAGWNRALYALSISFYMIAGILASIFGLRV